jgi:hypothetical protein
MKRPSGPPRWIGLLVVLLCFVLGGSGRPPGAWGAVSTQDQYIDLMTKSLDRIVEKLRERPRHPVLFSANLFFAHGAVIPFVPPETLLRYADALSEGGARRIDINPAIDPWRDSTPEIIQKYDALIAHIRDGGLQLAINPEYNRTTDGSSDFASWTTAALPAYAEIARRYQPDIFVVVHEPTTMAARMRQRVSAQQWFDFAQAAIRAVKDASPKTRCGVGVLEYEAAYIQRFLALDGLDTVSLDIYTLRRLEAFDAIIKAAQARGKAVYIEETWRPTYTGVEAGGYGTLEDFVSRAIGNRAFAEIDAKWLEAISLYASAWNLEAITPFWTQTFFLYVTGGGDGGLDPEYDRRVAEAIDQGARTATFDAYKALAAELK